MLLQYSQDLGLIPLELNQYSLPLRILIVKGLNFLMHVSLVEFILTSAVLFLNFCMFASNAHQLLSHRLAVPYNFHNVLCCYQFDSFSISLVDISSNISQDVILMFLEK